MKSKRVVVTGLGVASPNGVGIADFTASLREGRSGISFQPELERLGFRSQGCRTCDRPRKHH